MNMISVRKHIVDMDLVNDITCTLQKCYDKMLFTEQQGHDKYIFKPKKEWNHSNEVKLVSGNPQELKIILDTI